MEVIAGGIGCAFAVIGMAFLAVLPLLVSETWRRP